MKGFDDIVKIILSFLTEKRFYSSFAAKMTKTKTKMIPTAGVRFDSKGQINLAFNPDFLFPKEREEQQAIIEHEILHIFWRHLTRFPELLPDMKGITEAQIQQQKIANIGCDMAINQYIKNLPEGVVYPSTYNLPEEKAADFYIAELKKLIKENKVCPNCMSKMKGQDGKSGKNSQGQQDQGNGKDKQQQGGGKGSKNAPKNNGCENCGGKSNFSDKMVGDHSGWGKAIDGDGNEIPLDQIDFDPEYTVDNIVRNAIEECSKNYGDMPSFVEKEIAKLLAKKRHNWKKEMRVFVNSVLSVTKRLSQKRVNRRFTEQDYVLPGKKKAKKPKLMLVRDTSGSMWVDKVQNEILNEMMRIQKFCDIFVCDCDTRVHQVYKAKNKNDFKKYQGGGGTSFEPAFEAAKKKGVDGIIYLTDTYGSFPDRKDIGKFASKTIWATFDQKNVTLPFGKHINIDTTEFDK